MKLITYTMKVEGYEANDKALTIKGCTRDAADKYLGYNSISIPNLFQAPKIGDTIQVAVSYESEEADAKK